MSVVKEDQKGDQKEVHHPTVRERHSEKEKRAPLATMRNWNFMKECATEKDNELSSALADYVHDKTIDENVVRKIDVLTSLLEDVLVNELGVDGSEVGKELLERLF